MISRYHQRWMLFILVVAGWPQSTRAELSSGEILSNAWCKDCLQWRVSGVCFWMTCTPFGCYFDTSVRVTHFIPEAVVTSYSSTSPWDVMGEGVNGVLSTGDTEKTVADAGHLRFKNVDVVGSPALRMFNELGRSSDYFCVSDATAYFPYFRSSLDKTGWHQGLPEIFYPQSYGGSRIDNADNNSDINQLTNTDYAYWGSLYPRQGFLVQQDDPKAAAVMAQRAADIVTQDGQPHIYWPLPGPDADCGDKKCWPPGHAEIKDPKTHTWQMLYPRQENSCTLFGVSGDWSQGLNEQQEQYAWHLWRPWSCCDKAGKIFLSSVTFDE